MNIVCQLGELYIYVIIARAIFSFFPISSGSPVASIVEFLYKVTEPVFQPIRRVLPPLGGLDLTPLVLIIAINIVMASLGC